MFPISRVVMGESEDAGAPRILYSCGLAGHWQEPPPAINPRLGVYSGNSFVDR